MSAAGHGWVQAVILWGSLVSGGGILLLYPALVLRKYIRILVNILDDHDPVPENGGSDLGDLPGEAVTFRATDGHPLEGVILTGRGISAPKGFIIFGHEFCSDKTSCRRYCRRLLAAGYDVLTFDFRGHGDSPPEMGYRPRPWPSDREKADMLGAISFSVSYLERQGRPPEVGLFGVSRGAGAAILAAAETDGVRAIVTDGAFSSDTTLEYLMKRFASIFARIRVVAENHPPAFWRFLRWLVFRECSRKFGCRFPSVRKAVAQLGNTPVLFIHGEKDSYVPVAQSRALYGLAAGTKELWIVPGAKHNQSVRVASEQYALRVLRFFQAHLAAGGAAQPVASAQAPRRERVEYLEAFKAVLPGLRFPGPSRYLRKTLRTRKSISAPLSGEAAWPGRVGRSA